jgi:hypothetical protein
MYSDAMLRIKGHIEDWLSIKRYFLHQAMWKYLACRKVIKSQEGDQPTQYCREDDKYHASLYFKQLFPKYRTDNGKYKIWAKYSRDSFTQLSTVKF